MTTPYGELVYSPKLRSHTVARRQVSQYTHPALGLRIVENGTEVDPTADTLQLTLTLESDFTDTGAEITEIVTGTDLVKQAVGVYSYQLPDDFTLNPAQIKAHWEWQKDGQEGNYVDFLEVVPNMPTYDSLTDDEKAAVCQVSNLFGDLYDNTTGGRPYFAEEFQTNYGYERIAQLMYHAVTRINLGTQPTTSFRVGPDTRMGGGFPVQWVGLLVYATYIEVLKHFVRSYVEQPSINGTGVAIADRRDYMQRWQSVLQMELEEFKQLLRQFKRKQMNLGGGSLIVEGGIYGGLFVSGMYAAQTRALRMYPAAPAISFGSRFG